jgi:hypothetical protein
MAFFTVKGDAAKLGEVHTDPFFSTETNITSDDGYSDYRAGRHTPFDLITLTH